jgi:HAD superfamily hydrolase (TIGR01662 family)
VAKLVRAVLLDLGDTLVHLDRPWEEVFKRNIQALCNYLTDLGLELDINKFTETFCRMFDNASASADLYKIEIPMEEILSKVLRKSRLQILGVDLPTNATMEFFRPEVESWQLYPDSIEALRQFSKAGYALGLVSNAKSDWAVRSIVERSDMGKFLDSIVSSAALKVRKPRPEIFMHALDSLKVKPSDSVFVGDSLHADVAGANSMGMRSIHVRRKPIEEDHLTRPNATVTSLSEAVEVVSKWNSDSAS